MTARQTMKRHTVFRLICLFVALGAAGSLHAAGGKENWTKYCARCHGEDGTANTKMGKKLRIKNLTQAKIQSRLTDDRIKEAIAQGNKNEDGEEMMPAFKDKLSDAERSELVGYIRSLAAKE